MLGLVKSHGYQSADEFNAAKMREFFERGRTTKGASAADYRDTE